MTSKIHLLYDHEVAELNHRYLTQVVREQLSKVEGDDVATAVLTSFAETYSVSLVDPVEEQEALEEEHREELVEEVEQTNDTDTVVEEPAVEDVPEQSIVEEEEEEEGEKIVLNPWGLPETAEKAERDRLNNEEVRRSRNNNYTGIDD